MPRPAGHRPTSGKTTFSWIQTRFDIHILQLVRWNVLYFNWHANIFVVVLEKWTWTGSEPWWTREQSGILLVTSLLKMSNLDSHQASSSHICVCQVISISLLLPGHCTWHVLDKILCKVHGGRKSRSRCEVFKAKWWKTGWKLKAEISLIVYCGTMTQMFEPEPASLLTTPRLRLTLLNQSVLRCEAEKRKTQHLKLSGTTQQDS